MSKHEKGNQKAMYQQVFKSKVTQQVQLKCTMYYMREQYNTPHTNETWHELSKQTLLISISSQESDESTCKNTYKEIAEQLYEHIPELFTMPNEIKALKISTKYTPRFSTTPQDIQAVKRRPKRIVNDNKISKKKLVPYVLHNAA